ncbi:L-seryl-tRNA(Sec) selenium transferase, partial [Paraburkholderia dipogonis]
MSDVSGSELRALMARVPSVEKVMASAEFAALLAEYGRTQVLTAVRGALDS